MGFLHTCLAVEDAEETASWYVEELGFERSWEFDIGDTRNVYIADENGVELQLADTEGETPGETGDLYDHFAVSVKDVDAAVEEIDHHGVRDGPMDVEPAKARVAFVYDPDGHVVELIEPWD